MQDRHADMARRPGPINPVRRASGMAQCSSTFKGVSGSAGRVRGRVRRRKRRLDSGGADL